MGTWVLKQIELGVTAWQPAFEVNILGILGGAFSEGFKAQASAAATAFKGIGGALEDPLRDAFMGIGKCHASAYICTKSRSSLDKYWRAFGMLRACCQHAISILLAFV